MPRYELVEGTSSKFWEIELEGTSFTTRYGRIGTDGQTTTKEWKTKDEAKKQYDKIVAEKTKKGYELVGEGDGDDDESDDEDDGEGGGGGASNAELEKAIYADPDSPDAYLVYGDWLQGQNDPLGELIAVQAALAADPSPKLKAKSKALLEKHEEDWLGEALGELKSNGELTCTWRHGFLEKVAMGGDEGGESSSTEAYAGLAKCRVAKFLRDLEINVLDAEDGNPDYGPLINQMAKLGLPPALRRLAFDVKSFQISWASLGDLSKLYPQLQKLEELRIAIGKMKLGKLDLPSLKKLEIITGGLDKATMKAVATAKWPKLETLVLYFGDDGYGGDCSAKDLAPIFAGQNIPNVKHLGLCNAHFQDDIARGVAGSKVLAQLHTLDLSKGMMGDEGAQAILDNAKGFAHLKQLDLSENYVSSAMAKKLKAALGKNVELDASSQGDADDPEDRYVQISE
jgi:uncharacterized protein (TIGR02996 family)